MLLYNDKQWKVFFELIGQPDLMDGDPRLNTVGRRTEHIGELYRMVAEAMATRTTADWITTLESADMPVMRMNTVESLMADPHLEAVGFFEIVEHPSEGAVRSMAIPSTWSRTPPKVTRLQEPAHDGHAKDDGPAQEAEHNDRKPPRKQDDHGSLGYPAGIDGAAWRIVPTQSPKPMR